MAAVARRYQPSWKLALELDDIVLKTTGMTITEEVDEDDTSTNGDNGESDAEAGLKTTRVDTEVNLPAGGVRPDIKTGERYNGVVTSQAGVTMYDGVWLVTSSVFTGNLRGVVKLALKLRNSGGVTPVVTP